MSDVTNRYYLNADTNEREPALYRVLLVMSATHEGSIEIEATSENEAIDKALHDASADVRWEYLCDDQNSIEVFEVYCEEPPEGAYLIETYRSEATLDALFGPDSVEPGPQAEL